MKMFIYKCIILFCAVAFSIVAESRDLTGKDVKKLNTYLKSIIDNWDVPGMSVAVVQNGKILLAEGYGVKETGKNDAVDEHTLYAIASNSKAFTSVLIGVLADEGKLNLDDKVIDHVPYFRLSDPWITGAVTIRDLLCHRVGLGTFSGDVLWYKSDYTPEELIKRVRYIEPDFEFRGGFGYSNLMYITAGEVIRSVTGNPWHTEVEKRIFNPLNMNRSITSPAKLREKGNFATPHSRKDDKNVPIEWEDWQHIGALGGVISSVSDISVWMNFLLNRFAHNDDTLVSANYYNQMMKPHNNFTVDHFKDDNRTFFNGYGLGIKLNDHKGKAVAGHTGGYDGMISALTLIPEDNAGIVVLTNGVQSPIRAVTDYFIELVSAGNHDPSISEKHLTSKQSPSRTQQTIEKKIQSRKEGTSPTLPLDRYAGTYRCKMYGDVLIEHQNEELKLEFPRAQDLSATLRHWHDNVWKIEWDKEHAWFSFGTVQFELDNDLKVSQLNFDVPNNDIFFREINAIKQ